MPSNELHGPHPLTKKGIDDNVKGVGLGAYALGHVDQSNAFNVTRVGRSDDDLNKRLHDYEGLYESFKYAFLPNSKAAFEKECRLYHDFIPPDNIIHPAKPVGTDYKCPVAGCEN
ncbi:MAG: hypothetical protein WBW16_09190 [Bacteroidota bacterium]